MAEGGGLLNRYRTKSSIGGSNPPLSATHHQNLCHHDAIVHRARCLRGDGGLVRYRALPAVTQRLVPRIWGLYHCVVIAGSSLIPLALKALLLQFLRFRAAVSSQFSFVPDGDSKSRKASDAGNVAAATFYWDEAFDWSDLEGLAPIIGSSVTVSPPCPWPPVALRGNAPFQCDKLWKHASAISHQLRIIPVERRVYCSQSLVKD